MRLLDLPLEILDEIIALTLPEGIENFSLTCKVVNIRAAAQIARHNTLKRKWRHALVTGSPHISAMRMLCEIACDPLVAHYVESIHLRSPSTVITEGSAGDVAQDIQLHAETDDLSDIPLEGEVMENVAAIVTSSPFLELAGIDPTNWWNILEAEMHGDGSSTPYSTDYEDALCTIVALLEQLPNLKELQLPPAWSDFQPLADAENEETIRLTNLLDAMVNSANQNLGSSQSLSKLRTILPFMSEGYEERAGLQCLLPFLELDSVKELYAISCLAVDDSYTGIPFKWRSPEKASSLTRVELAYCCMDADGISALVSHTPCLQVFRYSHQTKWHGCQHDWNPGTFNEALARYCGKTLIDLAITIDEVYGEIENGASSFLSFPNLQYLEADVLIFCGPPVESGQRRGISGMMPVDQKVWSHDDIPCIGSMLPDNIVEFQLNTDFPEPDENALRALLKNIRPQRQDRLKKLKKAVIRQQNSSTGQTLADEQGVTLEIFGIQDAPRSMMPNWKRQFERRVGGIHFT